MNNEDREEKHTNQIFNTLKFQSSEEVDKINNFLSSLNKEEEENFVKREADKHLLPYIDLKGVAPEPDALKQIKEKDAREYKMAPFKQIGSKLYVAMFNPDKEGVSDILKNLTSHGFEIIKFMASNASLEHV